MPRPLFILVFLALPWLTGSLFGQARPLRPEDTPALPPEEALAPEHTPAQPADEPLAILPTDWISAQVELSRRGFSSGSIDGVRGAQTVAALKAFQRNEGLPITGELDLATREVLLLTAPALVEYVITEADLATPQAVPDTWLGKSQVPELGYGSVLELIAERFRVSPKLLARLNPAIRWEAVAAGMHVRVPSAEPFLAPGRVDRVHIYLGDHTLQAVDEYGRILFHCPVSIAREVEKRPVGELLVTVVIPNPNYTFDPVVFPESEEGRQLGRRLIIPPGPNNPVGVAWVGLNRPGYGIHGTPEPEKVGRTESHGCFRLANWDARTFLRVARVGLPVLVDP